MATGAQASAVDPQQAAAILRLNQQAKRRSRGGSSFIGKLANQTSARVRSAVFAAGLLGETANGSLAAMPQESAWSKAEEKLDQQDAYAAALHRTKLEQQVRGALLQLPPSLSVIEESDAYERAEETYEEQTRQIRAQSLNTRVENLGPLRQELRQATDQATKELSQAIDQGIEDVVERAVADLGLDSLNLLDTPGEDGWITWIVTFFINNVRAGVTILVPDPGPQPIRNASDVQKTVKNKLLKMFRYKFIGGNVMDIADFGYLLFQWIIIGAIMAVAAAILFIFLFILYKILGVPLAILNSFPSL